VADGQVRALPWQNSLDPKHVQAQSWMQASVETGDEQDTDAHVACRVNRTAQRAALTLKVFIVVIVW